MARDRVTAESIALVGEYTVPAGPFIEDHFLVVIFRSGKLVEYSGEDAMQMIEQLEDAIDMPILYDLCSTTELASRVIFPPTLMGRPLFSFFDLPKGVLGFLRTVGNFGVGEVVSSLTEEVRTYLEREKSEDPARGDSNV